MVLMSPGIDIMDLSLESTQHRSDTIFVTLYMQLKLSNQVEQPVRRLAATPRPARGSVAFAARQVSPSNFSPLTLTRIRTTVEGGKEGRKEGRQ